MELRLYVIKQARDLSVAVAAAREIRGWGADAVDSCQSVLAIPSDGADTHTHVPTSKPRSSQCVYIVLTLQLLATSTLHIAV